MKRTPLLRKSPLVAKTALKRGKGLRKRSKRQAKRERELTKSRRIVRERSGGQCEFPGCRNRAVHAHHKRLRSQGGSDAPENLLDLCHECHEVLHRNPHWANELGLIQRTGDPDPDETAMGKALNEFDATAFCRAVGRSHDAT